MSYAAAAKHAPTTEDPHPDTSLLTTPADLAADRPVSPGAPTEDHETAHVVDRDEFEKLKSAVELADEPQSTVDEHFAEAQAHQAERDQAQLKAKAQAELKATNDTVAAEGEKAKEKGKEVVDEVERKGEKLVGEAKQKGKELEKEAKAKYQEGKKDVKEFADKVEREGKKEAKKLQKKASEVEREGRALAKQYPLAATGIVGLTNLLLIAVPSYFAWKHWDLPRWDRRIVSAVGVGLAAAFGLESSLGYFEYQQEHRK
ncbi:hypothetical protein JCM10450v2_005524 [Rhodotorula kratochvilovae]